MEVVALIVDDNKTGIDMLLLNKWSYDDVQPRPRGRRRNRRWKRVMMTMHLLLLFFQKVKIKLAYLDDPHSSGCVILRAPPEYPSNKRTTPSNVRIAHVATTLGSSIGGNYIDTSAPTHSYTSNDRYIHSPCTLGPASNIRIVQKSLTPW